MKFNRTITIGNRIVSDTSRVFIIAEAGVNHNGDMKLARQLIDAASQAGADAVKFQAFRTEHLILSHVPKAAYQQKNTGGQESQFNMLKKLEVSQEESRELKEHCQKKKMLFLTTPFDEYSLKQLDELDVAAYKISSTDTTNLPFLKRVAKRKKPIILSTGMSYLWEVEKALRTIFPLNKDVILLQCTSNYPVKSEEVNLNVINTYRQRFPLLLGFSDHTEGVGASPYAVAMGAKVIEKHFTLDKNLPGPDHKASLSPAELKAFVAEIRKVELYLGSAEKAPTVSEKGTKKMVQKFFVAAQAIKKGDVFSEENLVAKRTGGKGISPTDYGRIFGKRAKRNFSVNEILKV